MEKFNLDKIKLQVRPSFFIAFFLFCINGLLSQFLIVLTIVSVHELAHVLAGYFFGVSTEKIVITAIGECAVLNHINELKRHEKFILYIIGPMVNILWGFIILTYYNINPMMEFIMNTNFAIGLFNLMPFYPLDGGKILYLYLGNKLGILNAVKIIARTGRLFGIFLIFIGIIQITLFSFNASFLCLGIYFTYTSKKSHLLLVLDFYREMFSKYNSIHNQKSFTIKHIIVSKKISVQEILNMLNWDYYYFIYVYEEKLFIDEYEVLKHVFCKGAGSDLESIIKKN